LAGSTYPRLGQLQELRPAHPGDRVPFPSFEDLLKNVVRIAGETTHEGERKHRLAALDDTTRDVQGAPSAANHHRRIAANDRFAFPRLDVAHRDAAVGRGRITR
jgi:hypothetical protein